ncbi:histidine kinase dimerization/phosphoacceptor domain -containing protein [Yoonia sp. BS5-3]|uniref:Histidine kinase dimerization/phosphoacceptor domain -containing protein n=1 Tax=Yoonia phaeophyticola TaxID=3137369 RepID=A0ABZ2V443_9RHOB
MNAPHLDLVTLQKEVFHHVSNNFQIIQSMIRLVSRDPSVIDVASELEQRIQLLSIAHTAQNCFDSAAIHSIETALPNLILGVQRGGFLLGRQIVQDVSCSPLSVQRTYAVLHVLVEVLRVLNRSTARNIVIALSDDELVVSSDAEPIPLNESTIALTAAFARELGTAPTWSDTGLTLKLR